MRQLIHITFYTCLAIGLFSCGKESSCFKGTGDILVEERAITSDIVKVRISDNIDLVITQNSKASLTLQAGENLLPYIASDINGSELKLYSDNKCGFFRDYNKRITAYLQLPNLEHIIVEGQGNVSSANTLNSNLFKIDAYNATGSLNLTLNANSVEVKQHTGPMDMTIAGSTDRLFAFTGGNGWLTLNGLSANNVHVNQDGTGDINVSAANSLLVELTSLGNIDYYGNPTLTISTHTGKGLIRKK